MDADKKAKSKKYEATRPERTSVVLQEKKW